MNERERVLGILGALKAEAGEGSALPTPDPEVALHPVTADLVEGTAPELLARWRTAGKHGFPQQIPVTVEGTRAWARSQLVRRPDRILFFVVDSQHRRAGQMGLSSMDFDTMSCEFDNIVRADVRHTPGIMTRAGRILLDWTYNELRMRRIWLRVRYDNFAAVSLYYRLGFQPTRLTPIRHVPIPDGMAWETAPEGERFDSFWLDMDHCRAG